MRARPVAQQTLLFARPVAQLFGLPLVVLLLPTREPDFERFRRWADDDMGDNGVPICIGSFDASPFHWIQRDLSRARDAVWIGRKHRAQGRAVHIAAGEP